MRLYAIMARLYAIMFTIIFPIIFPIIMFRIECDYFVLFLIISGCLHTENANVQTAILDPFMQEWLVGVDEECLHIWIDWKATEGKAAWWSVPVLVYTLFFLFYAIFVLAE